ncbi:hypothetical protein DFH07DRAFT_158132 [Mycena maculata]|uniref:Transmembrane protein n=1 Tax=Mycena maculata TaxID=230809 RepID=A0AAD7HXT4_9AGAR|nr:hypothetical protein DFH07DRAFT_158132 [Mycena maculata]
MANSVFLAVTRRFPLVFFFLFLASSLCLFGTEVVPTSDSDDAGWEPPVGPNVRDLRAPAGSRRLPGYIVTSGKGRPRVPSPDFVLDSEEDSLTSDRDDVVMKDVGAKEPQEEAGCDEGRLEGAGGGDDIAHATAECTEDNLKFNAGEGGDVTMGAEDTLESSAGEEGDVDMSIGDDLVPSGEKGGVSGLADGMAPEVKELESSDESDVPRKRAKVRVKKTVMSSSSEPAEDDEDTTFRGEKAQAGKSKGNGKGKERERASTEEGSEYEEEDEVTAYKNGTTSKKSSSGKGKAREQAQPQAQTADATKDKARTARREKKNAAKRAERHRWALEYPEEAVRQRQESGRDRSPVVATVWSELITQLTGRELAVQTAIAGHAY